MSSPTSHDWCALLPSHASLPCQAPLANYIGLVYPPRRRGKAHKHELVGSRLGHAAVAGTLLSPTVFSLTGIRSAFDVDIYRIHRIRFPA